MDFPPQPSSGGSRTKLVAAIPHPSQRSVPTPPENQSAAAKPPALRRSHHALAAAAAGLAGAGGMRGSGSVGTLRASQGSDLNMGGSMGSVRSLGGSMTNLKRAGGNAGSQQYGSMRSVRFGAGGMGSLGSMTDGMSTPVGGMSSAGSIAGFGRRNKGSMGSLREPTLYGMFRFRFCKREESDIFSVKFSPDEDYVACGMGDANIQVYSTRTNEAIRTLIPPNFGDGPLPCTSITFRPDNSSFKNKNVLVASYADGRVIHWHHTSGQILNTLTLSESQINNVSYQPSGARFATAGSDSYVRVFDASTFQSTADMSTGKEGVSAGHAGGRVFSVKFHPTDPNILISGGWDNTVQVWDTRVEHSIRSIYGPHVCGDAIDFDDDGSRILTGGFQKEDQLQIWSFASRQLIETVTWSVIENDRRNTQLYTASFSHLRAPTTSFTASANPSAASPVANRYILAGGGGGGQPGTNNNELKLFNASTGRCVALAQGFSGSVYTAAVSAGERMVAVGGASRSLYVYDLDAHQLQDFVY
ncbi:hypothetical protein HK101_008535 [Irineochytrium annulatum]|nr:hypothetical protein HK101_008535 [Irineochytrium annulatum]